MDIWHPIPPSQVDYPFDVGVLFRFMSSSASFVLIHGRLGSYLLSFSLQSTRDFFGLRCEALDGLLV